MKIKLFLLMAALFCFSYSALAEPANINKASPVVTTKPVSKQRKYISVEPQQTFGANSTEPAPGSKVRTKNKIFENLDRACKATSGFV